MEGSRSDLRNQTVHRLHNEKEIILIETNNIIRRLKQPSTLLGLAGLGVTLFSGQANAWEQVLSQLPQVFASLGLIHIDV